MLSLTEIKLEINKFYPNHSYVKCKKIPRIITKIVLKIWKFLIETFIKTPPQLNILKHMKFVDKNSHKY